MAHFAQIDQNNKVIRVVVVNNSEIIDPQTGEESELLGVRFFQNMFGNHTRWVQCSYNYNIRKNFPSEGYIFDSELDMFYAPKPYKAWVLNTDTGIWEAPFPAPDNGVAHMWDNATDSWIEDPAPMTEVYYIDPATGKDVRIK